MNNLLQKHQTPKLRKLQMKNFKQVDFTSVIHFCSSLEENGVGVWEDSFGKYRITIDQINLMEKLRSIPNPRIFYSKGVADFLPELVNFNDGKSPSSAISIGTFNNHNTAKLFCIEKECHLITVPAPLSNDSFGTNRVQYQKYHPSTRGVFPSETIIDCNLIKQFPYSSNLLGLGEFIGLYFSIIDYCYSRNLEIPVDVINYIIKRCEKISRTITCDDSFCVQLGVNLIFKCLIMRKNIDHQIGCGIDHLLGGYLETKLNIPHGHAIFLGCLISTLFFPEWQEFGLDIHKLISFGKSNGWLTRAIINKLTEITPEYLVNGALKLRPDRPTMLRTVSPKKTGGMWEQLNSLTDAMM